MAMSAIEKTMKEIATYKSSISTTCQVGYNISTDVAGCVPGITESGDSASYSTQPLRIYDKNLDIGIVVSSIKAPKVRKKSGRSSNKRLFGHFDSNIRRNERTVDKVQNNKKPGSVSGIRQTRFCSVCKSPNHDARTCTVVARSGEQQKCKKKKRLSRF